MDKNKDFIRKKGNILKCFCSIKVLLPNGQFAHVKIFKPLKCNALQTADRSSLVTVDKEAKNE